MQDVESIKRTLTRLKPKLKEKYGVETIGVFGSYVRGEQTKKSDVDVLMVFSEDVRVGFFKFLELEEFLTRRLRVKVDLVTRNALKPHIGERILEEVIML